MPSAPSWAVALGVAVLAIALWYALLPWLVRPMFRLLLWPRYRIKVAGQEHLPATGPVLLAANHISWIDGFVLVAACPRRGKALINASYINLPVLRQVALRAGLIPVPFAGERGQHARAVIKAAQETLDRGEALGIFPEAQISRTGMPGRFRRGMEVILAGRERVPVLPVYLGNLWGSLFSHSGGRFFRKWPRGLRRTVCVVFGPPVPGPVTVFAVRQEVLAAGVRAVELCGAPARLPETLDPALPRWEHPEFGLLTASTADFDRGDVRQVGQKPGTVGHPVPGVALRAVDDAGHPVGPDAVGRLQVLLPGRPAWADTGRRGGIDRDGFVRLA